MGKSFHEGYRPGKPLLFEVLLQLPIHMAFELRVSVR